MTTLVTTIQGIGLGVMGKSLVEHVANIGSVLAVRRMPDVNIDLEFPERCSLNVCGYEIKEEHLRGHSKLLYIEQSYGASRFFAGRELLFVPMWEQGLTKHECAIATKIISVTKHTQKVCGGIYLPWPVDTEVSHRVVTNVRTILHNAGSLGGNLRKGTLEAIELFQRSGVVKSGVQMVVHAWKSAPEEVALKIGEAPEGIIWTNLFLPRAEDVYDVVKPDLLLMPSKIEGHALVALEAMARGIPTLVTDTAPINEYEEDERFRLPVGGFQASPLAAPYEIVNVGIGAEKLRLICEMDLSEKSRQVRSFVEKNMSWRVLGPSWEGLCA